MIDNLPFIQKITLTMNFFKNIVTENIEKTKTKIKETLMQKLEINNVYEKCFKVINTYAAQKEKVMGFIKKIYNSDPKIKTIIDNVVYLIKYAYCSTYGKRIEPMNDKWICISVLLKRNASFIGEEFNYNETYEFVNNDDILDPLKEMSDNISSIVESTNNTLEGMITMKIGEKYINRIFFNKNEPKMDTELPLVPSKHRLISVKYKHPNMDEPIFIDIDKEYYYTNNEILSPLFIKRYLEYQHLIYDFDMNYELEIMDNDINTYVINSKQYILLADNTYTIKNIE
jgi:hypothetical protein